MKTNHIRQWSLKTKVTFSTLIIFLVSIWSLTSYATKVLREDIKRLLHEQQFTAVSIVASGIETEIRDRLKLLENAASNITPNILGNSVSVQKFLEDRPSLEMMFSGGVFATRLDGTAIADIPFSRGRVGTNYSERPWMVETLKGKTTISEPVIGKQLKVPVFSMNVPIRDTEGKVIGVLVGVIDLSNPNFLDKITDNRYGKTGGYLLVSRQHRMYVTGTDKKLIAKPPPPPGVNPLFDRYMQGFEGSGSVKDSRGVEVLSSSKQIPAADWIIVARIPLKEAFAPIRAMQYRMYLAAVVLTFLTGGLIWWLLKRQLSPLSDTLNTLSALSESDIPVAPLPIIKHDEVGQLIGGFNRLLEALAQREKALKESEEAMRKSESKYRQLFQNQPTGFALHEIILDAKEKPYDYRFLEINPAFETLTGYKSDDIIGKTQLEVMPNHEPYWAEIYGNVALTGISITFEKYNEELNSYYQVSAYSPEPGKFATIFLDITERKSAEEKKLKLEQQLQQTQRLESLGVLAGGIAHDFNNILAIIMGNCSLAAMDNENVNNYISEIEKASERGAELCRQMLAYAGKAQFVQAKVNIRSLAGEMVSMLKKTVPQNAGITFDCSDDIPFIQGDASQLNQIVMNLIINASEAIGKEQGEICVSLAALAISEDQSDKDYNGNVIPPGRYVCLEVRDNGCGMDEETKWRIFEPFYTTKFTGRGLGMSAVLGIIKSHKGALQLYSQPGEGTTFKIYFPASNNGTTEETSAQQESQTPWQGSGKILLVEDEDQIRHIAKSLLEQFGFTVIEAVNGKEGLDLYQQHFADITLVLTDMGMPVMDGYALFHALKELKPSLPIVISSGFGDTEVSSRIDHNDIAGLISKPYTPDNMRKILKNVLNGNKGLGTY